MLLNTVTYMIVSLAIVQLEFSITYMARDDCQDTTELCSHTNDVIQ